MSLGVSNNNPLNIRYSKSNKWIGQVGSNKGFCVFSSMDFGLRAGFFLLRNYIRKGFNTPSLIINRFAPCNENDTLSYISYVSKGWNGDKNHIISTREDLALLVSRMSYFESNYKISVARILELFNKFNFKF